MLNIYAFTIGFVCRCKFKRKLDFLIDFINFLNFILCKEKNLFREFSFQKKLPIILTINTKWCILVGCLSNINMIFLLTFSLELVYTYKELLTKYIYCAYIYMHPIYMYKYILYKTSECFCFSFNFPMCVQMKIYLIKNVSKNIWFTT